MIDDFVDSCDRDTLGDGFRIETRIVVSFTSEDSLKVASGALFRDGNTWHVYLLGEDNFVEKHAVVPGQINGLETEIKSGLSIGDQVVLHPTDKVRDGVKVKQSK